MTLKNEIIGRGVFEVFPDNPDDPSADGVANLRRSLQAVVDTGKKHRMSVQRYDIRDLNGKFENRYWDPLNSPVFGENGELIYIIHSVQDVTLLERTKIDRDHLIEELKTSVKELEAFSYSVSHDLRAPLRAVNGYAQMLNEDYGSALDAKGKRIIETIRHNAIRMGTLIDDLLVFSRLGRKEMQRGHTNMNDLTEGVLLDIAKVHEHKATICVGKLHSVYADYGLIYQVMFNLISNAVKYSSKKPAPRITISSEKKDDEVIFTVKDNGAGFNMKYYDKLFGVFQRLHANDEFEGTGVGLAIVQRVISRHGGKVWGEGRPGEGATFCFSLQKGEDHES